MGKRQLYIFDLGNVVLCHVDVVPAITTILAEKAGHFLNRYETHMDELMTGAMSAERFWSLVAGDAQIEITKDYLAECFEPVLDPAVLQVIDDLRASGARVVCGTNTYGSHYALLKDSETLTHFDKVYASHIMGYAKPVREFYTYIMEQEGYEPQDVFFTDDLQKNVSAATNIGITAHQFIGAEPLRKVLGLPTLE